MCNACECAGIVVLKLYDIFFAYLDDVNSFPNNFIYLLWSWLIQPFWQWPKNMYWGSRKACILTKLFYRIILTCKPEIPIIAREMLQIREQVNHSCKVEILNQYFKLKFWSKTIISQLRDATSSLPLETKPFHESVDLEMDICRDYGSVGVEKEDQLPLQLQNFYSWIFYHTFLVDKLIF